MAKKALKLLLCLGWSDFFPLFSDNSIIFCQPFPLLHFDLLSCKYLSAHCYRTSGHYDDLCREQDDRTNCPNQPGGCYIFYGQIDR